MLYGVDLSNHNSALVSAADFTILKATEGLKFKDKKFLEWWAQLGAREALRGVYHFAHPSNDPIREARFFASVVRPVLAPGDLVVLDWEADDGTSPEHCSAWARTWLTEVEALCGRRPIVYTMIAFAREGRCAGLGAYPLWLADPSAHAGQPRVPAPWKTWALHQYSWAGGIDRDVFRGTPQDWHRLGGASGGDSMPQYVSLGLQKPVVLKNGYVRWDLEFSDGGHVHKDPGAYPALLTADDHARPFIVDVSTSVATEQVPGKHRCRLVEVVLKDHGSQVQKTYPWHPMPGPWTQAGRLDEGRHLYLEVEPAELSAPGIAPPTYLATGKALYW